MPVAQSHDNLLAMLSGLSDIFHITYILCPGVFSKLLLLIKFWARQLLTSPKCNIFEIALKMLFHSHILEELLFLYSTICSAFIIYSQFKKTLLSYDASHHSTWCLFGRHVLMSYNIPSRYKLNETPAYSSPSFIIPGS